jgi:hypothetical protein
MMTSMKEMRSSLSPCRVLECLERERRSERRKTEQSSHANGSTQQQRWDRSRVEVVYVRSGRVPQDDQLFITIK